MPRRYAIKTGGGELSKLSPELAVRRKQTQVSRRGNSLAVQLPATVVEAQGLEEGDDIEIPVARGEPLRSRGLRTPGS
jgi:hypothetical protein